MSASTLRRPPPDSATQDRRLALLLLPGLAAVAAAPLVGVSPLLPAGAALGLVLLGPVTARPHLPLHAVTVVLLLPAGLLPGALASAGLLLGLALTAAAWLRQALRTRDTLVPAPILLLVAFWCWSLLSVAWAERPVVARQTLVAFAIGITYLFLVVDLVRTRRQLSRLLDAVALAGWVLVAVGVLSLLTADRGDTARLTVLGSNSNQYGNLLLLCAAGVLYRATERGPRGRRRSVLPALAYLALSTALIALSASRGSLLASALLVLALLLLRSTRRWALGAVGAAAVVVMLSPAVLDPLLHRLSHPDPRQASRWSLLQSGFDVVAERPLLGHGVGNGAFLLPERLAERSSLDRVNGRESLPAHNPLVEVAMDTGLPGAVLFGAALITAAGGAGVTVLRTPRRQKTGLDAYGVAVGAVSVAFLLVWSKSGGMAPNSSTYLLLALWMLTSRAALPAGR